MDSVGTIILVGLLAGGLIWLTGTYLQRDADNLCVKANNQKFPFNATQQNIESKYGSPESKYTTNNTTKWLYNYRESFSMGKCKMVVIFQNDKVVDYKMKESSEAGYETLGKIFD